jgi:ParB family chromosome partitioning protein
METKKRALGRGLEELFNNENLDLQSMENKIYESATNEEIVEIPLEELRPNPYQPRKVFDEEALQDLADSIKEHGVFQPIIIKKSIKGYEIIAGERRYRASKIAGLTKIPAIIRNFTDEQMMEIALLENLQRENLNAIEEAIAYKKMIQNLGITQEELAKKVGKSRSHVTNIIGLLRLPQEVQQLVADSKITMGHARALSKLESEEEMKSLANKIIDEHLPVRQTEEDLSSDKIEKKVKISRVNNNSNTREFKYVEDLLRDKLDTKVRIKEKKIEISFTNVADLNRILEVLNVKE